jgi:peptidoglycan hydrolase-like protein with peptidoglycan-binding domain
VNLGPPPWSDDGRVVRRGPQSSAWIRHAQETLAARGFNPGPTDGVFGAQSVRATQDFQRANNLTVNGRLDAPTRAALNMSGAMPTQTRAASPSTR